MPFGIPFVRRVLEVEGHRKPARRNGRGSDEIAMRGAFRTYFPGAQWVGDGMQVPVVDGQCFVFNVELNVDAYAGAFVGTSVRDNEDSAAVVDAVASGIATTGARPIAARSACSHRSFPSSPSTRAKARTMSLADS